MVVQRRVLSAVCRRRFAGSVMLGMCLALSACEPNVPRYRSYALNPQYNNGSHVSIRGISEDGTRIVGCVDANGNYQMGTAFELQLALGANGYPVESYPGVASAETNYLSDGRTDPSQEFSTCAEDVNDSGQIIGRLSRSSISNGNNGPVGVYWQNSSHESVPVKLGLPASFPEDPFFSSTYPERINNNGYIAGTVFDTTFPVSGNGLVLAWDSASELQSGLLPSLGVFGYGSRTDLSSNNFVIDEISAENAVNGYELTGTAAFIYPHSPGLYGKAAAINDALSVLAFEGTAYPWNNGRPETQPVILKNDGSIEPIEPFQQPVFIDEARLTNDGTVYISAHEQGPGDTDTYFWRAGSKRKVADLIVENPNYPFIPTNWGSCKLALSDVNNRGDIIAQASCNSNNVPDYPYLLKRLLLGDFDQDGTIGCSDLYEFPTCKNKYAAGPVSSSDPCSIFDYNADGDIDSKDENKFQADSSALTNCPMPPV